MLVVIGGAGAWFVRKSLSPLQSLNQSVMQIAQQNYDVDLPDQTRKDEIGELSRSIEVLRNNALERLRLQDQNKLEQEERAKRQLAIEELIEGFRTSSSELLNNVASNMDNMRNAAKILASVAVETKDKATNSASASQEASGNVQTVATAAEELTASIEEIKRQVNETSSVVAQATKATQVTTETVEGLSHSAQKIGDVISLIQAIAEQTNLLALTPPSRQHEPASTVRALRSWRPRSRNWPPDIQGNRGNRFPDPGHPDCNQSGRSGDWRHCQHDGSGQSIYQHHLCGG